jgi:putative ABC transport system substrate-binding protein
MPDRGLGGGWTAVIPVTTPGGRWGYSGDVRPLTLTRRRFLQGSVAGLSLLTGCMPIRRVLVPAKRVPRIGYLGLAPIHFDDGFREGLRDLGYVEGENISIEWRWPEEGRVERYPEVVDELLRLNLDLLVARTTSASLAARRATSELPIVFSTVTSPLSAGLVTNLGRPEANVTGISNSVQGIHGKRLQLLRDVVPGATRIAVLGDFGNLTTNPSVPLGLQEARDAALSLGVGLREHHARGPDDFDGPFGAMKSERAEALVVWPSATVYLNARAHIVGLANKARLPSMFEAREWTEAGGLLAYGVDLYDVNRRVATYVDKILRGARPADLPVEQPTSFDFVINLKTANALGITIPQSALQQATEIIQ